MPEPILIGARGWEHPEWQGRFYPEELPADWRFCYYSNWLRAVLVPAETWEEVGSAEVRSWAEDSDPEFRFVLELPRALSESVTGAIERRALLTAFFKTIEPIRHQTAGLVVPAGSCARDPGALGALLNQLARSSLPLCVDLPSACRTPAFLEVVAAHAAGLLWRCAEEPAPPPVAGQRLLVALARTADPKAQRRLLEALAAWQASGSVVAIFFDDPQTGAEQAKQARMLAEIMGLA